MTGNGENLLPQQSGGADETDWAIEPTAQYWGFSEKPTWQQRECWANQERFLAEFAKRGKLYKSARACGLRRLTDIANTWELLHPEIQNHSVY